MNILISGHRGFVGRHLKKGLKEKFTNCHPQLSDTANINLLEPIDPTLIFGKLDYIFHLAAWTKAGDFCLHHPAEQWINNQKINTNMLCYWREHQPQAKLIGFGTSCAYPPEAIKSEDNYLDGLPDKDLFTYAMTKRMLFTGMKSFAQQFEMDYLYFIPNTLYGPDFDIEDSHFIFDLIKKICAAKYENKTPVTLWGSGNQCRELVYIDDAINLILNSCDEISNKIINLGTGSELRIKDYARIICDYVEYNYEDIEFDTSAFEGVQSKKLEPSPVAGACNHTSLEEGIKNTIDYYRNIKYGM